MGSANRDDSRIATLLGELRADVLRYVGRRVDSETDAEDITQEVLQTVSEMTVEQLLRVDHPTAFAKRIALRKVIDAHRRNGARNKYVEQYQELKRQEASASPSRYQELDLTLDLPAIRSRLDEKERIIFDLQLKESLTCREIEHRTGISKSDAARILKRIEMKLHAFFDEGGDR